RGADPESCETGAGQGSERLARPASPLGRNRVAETNRGVSRRYDRGQSPGDIARAGRLPRIIRECSLGALRPSIGDRSGALDNGEDVALAVLEPRRLRAAGGHDAARTLLARHVVVLEHDAARLQIGHLALDVVDLPERLACA